MLSRRAVLFTVASVFGGLVAQAAAARPWPIVASNDHPDPTRYPWIQRWFQNAFSKKGFCCDVADGFICGFVYRVPEAGQTVERQMFAELLQKVDGYWVKVYDLRAHQYAEVFAPPDTHVSGNPVGQAVVWLYYPDGKTLSVRCLGLLPEG